MLELRQGYRRDDGTHGLRQVEAAALSGLTQSKISRAERGTFYPQPGEVELYAQALGASPEVVAEAVELCEVEHDQHVMGQARLVRRGTEIQRRVERLERTSRRLRAWAPSTVPGLMQSWDYTVALIERDPDETWAAARRARLALLDDPDRQFHQVLSEAALRWVVGSRRVMTGQLQHLLALTERPNVNIGVVPFGQVVVPPPEGGFHLFDEAAVVATDAGTTFLDSTEDLGFFGGLFGRLEAAAVHGEEARHLIERAARAR